MLTWQYFAIFGCGLLFLGFLYFKSRRQAAKLPATEQKTVANPIHVILFDSQARTWGEKDIAGEIADAIRTEHGSLGRKWSYLSRFMFAIEKTKDGKYKPYVFTPDPNQSSTELYLALQQQAVGIYYDMREKKNFIEKHWQLLVFVGIALFLIWSAGMNKG